MKKLLISILATAMLATLLAGCGNDPLANGNQTATTVATQSSEGATEASTTADKTYDNSYDGLVSYMADKGHIVNEDKAKTQMNADIIGAEKGYRFANGTALVELYAFPETLNDTAKNIIDAVKNNGYYTLADTSLKAEDDTKVSAILSEDEKYILIYTDSEIKADEENTASQKRDDAIADFKNFNK